MASTYTTNIGIEKPATGEQSGTWGETVNTNYDIFDRAISGSASITLATAGTSGAPNTLDITDGALDEGVYAYINYVDGGDLGADAYVQLTPNDAQRIIWIKNSLSASRSLYIFQGTYNASNDYVLANGSAALLKFDGAGAGAVVALVMDDLLVDDLVVTGTLRVDGNNNSDGAVGGSITATFGNNDLTTQNTFYLGTYDNGNVKPALVFDEGASDIDGIYYIRSSDTMCFAIANTNYITMKSTEVTLQTDLVLRDEVYNWANNQVVRIGSGSSAGVGANLNLHGSTEANAYDVEFKSDTTTELQFDASANKWDFQANAVATTGTVAIGDTAPIDTEKLLVKLGDSGAGATQVFSSHAAVFENSGDAGILIASPNTNTSLIDFGDADVGNAGRIRFAHASDVFSFQIGGSNIASWHADRTRSEFPFQVKESAAGVANNAGYGQVWVKDDTPCVLWYTDDAGNGSNISPVTGSFTPVIEDASHSQAEGQTYSTQHGFYSKSGNMVYFGLGLTTSSLGTLSGTLYIGGLPETASSTSPARWPVTVSSVGGLSVTAGTSICADIVGGQTYMILRLWNLTTGTQTMAPTDVAAGALTIYISGQYPI